MSNRRSGIFQDRRTASVWGAKRRNLGVKGVSSSWQRISLTSPSVAGRVGGPALVQIRQTPCNPGSSASAEPVPITPMKLKIVDSVASEHSSWKRSQPEIPILYLRYSANPVVGRRPLLCVTGNLQQRGGLLEGRVTIGKFRTEGMDRIPHLHVGRSKDGFRFTFEPKPIDLKCEDPEVRRFEYAYDPRVTLVDGVYCRHLGIITAVWSIGHRPDEGLRPLRAAGERVPSLQPQRSPFPQQVLQELPDAEGRLFWSGHECPATSSSRARARTQLHWGKHRHVIGKGGPWWQGTKIGAGPSPIETNEGWLLFYHGVTTTCNGFVYSIGAMLPDRHEPWKVGCLREGAPDRARGAVRGGRVCPRRLLPRGMPLRRADRPDRDLLRRRRHVHRALLCKADRKSIKDYLPAVVLRLPGGRPELASP